jgi:PGF-pre-PGF domain-containing protein
MSFHTGKLNEEKVSSRKSLRRSHNKAVTILVFLLFLASFCGSAGADYFSPAPPSSNTVNQTYVSVALTTPATKVHINVTEYDAQQMVKNMTIDFSEPINYIGLVIDVLKDKPLIVNEPNTGPIIQYYDIRYLTELEDKVTKVTMVFAVEKAALQNMSVEEDSLLLYQYNGNKFVVCPIQKVAENKTYLFFKTETTGHPLFAITGGTVPSPWWSSILPIAIITLLAIIGIYVYKSLRLNRRPKPVRT